MQLIESEALQTKEGHVFFKQLIRDDEHPQGYWLDTDLSADPTPDSDGFTAEHAFLLSLSLTEETTVDDIQARLKAGETIYLVKPPESSSSVSSGKE
jgi:hypothetical protein